MALCFASSEIFSRFGTFVRFSALVIIMVCVTPGSVSCEPSAAADAKNDALDAATELLRQSEDLRGMRVAQGILTAFGGASSHAALVSGLEYLRARAPFAPQLPPDLHAVGQRVGVRYTAVVVQRGARAASSATGGEGGGGGEARAAGLEAAVQRGRRARRERLRIV